MLTCWVKCRKNSKNGRTIMQSKCAVYGIKNSRFVKEQEAKGLLENLGIKTPLNKIPLLGDILFQMYENEWNRKQIFSGRT